MTANPDETLDHRVPTPADLAGIVKAMRTMNKWSQATLAELARLTERTIQRVENSEPSSFDTRRALAGAFGCKDLDIFEKPWPFPSVEKLKADAAELEKTTIAITLSRMPDGRSLRAMVEPTHAFAADEIGELSPTAREAFAAMVDYVRDYNDAEGLYSMTQRLEAERDIDAFLKTIANEHAAVGAGLRSGRFRLQSGSPDQEPLNWTYVYFVLAPEGALPSTVRVPRSVQLA